MLWKLYLARRGEEPVLSVPNPLVKMVIICVFASSYYENFMNSNRGAIAFQKKMLIFYEFFIQGVFLKLSKNIYY